MNFSDASFPKAVKSIEENIEKNHKIHRQQWPSHWNFEIQLWIITMTHTTMTSSSYHHRQWKKPHNPKHLAQKKNQKLYLLIYKSFWLNSVSEKIVMVLRIICYVTWQFLEKFSHFWQISRSKFHSWMTEYIFRLFIGSKIA